MTQNLRTRYTRQACNCRRLLCPKRERWFQGRTWYSLRTPRAQICPRHIPSTLRQMLSLPSQKTCLLSKLLCWLALQCNKNQPDTPCRSRSLFQKGSTIPRSHYTSSCPEHHRDKNTPVGMRLLRLSSRRRIRLRNNIPEPQCSPCTPRALSLHCNYSDTHQLRSLDRTVDTRLMWRPHSQNIGPPHTRYTEQSRSWL